MSELIISISNDYSVTGPIFAACFLLIELIGMMIKEDYSIGSEIEQLLMESSAKARGKTLELLVHYTAKFMSYYCLLICVMISCPHYPNDVHNYVEAFCIVSELTVGLIRYLYRSNIKACSDKNAYIAIAYIVKAILIWIIYKAGSIITIEENDLGSFIMTFAVILAVVELFVSSLLYRECHRAKKYCIHGDKPEELYYLHHTEKNGVLVFGDNSDFINSQNVIVRSELEQINVCRCD